MKEVLAMKVLDRPVKRVTKGMLDLHLPGVVTLYPGDVIGIKLFRQRREWRTTLLSCYHMAVKQELRAERQRREGQRKER
jgi:hypothetical protein